MCIINRRDRMSVIFDDIRIPSANVRAFVWMMANVRAFVKIANVKAFVKLVRRSYSKVQRHHDITL